MGCSFDLPPFRSFSPLSSPLSRLLSLSLYDSRISCFSSAQQHFSCLLCIPHQFFHFLGRFVISLFIFTGVFTNFPSISSLSAALNFLACCVLFLSVSVFNVENFFYWPLGFYALLIIYCQLARQHKAKKTNGSEREKKLAIQTTSLMPPTCLLFNISSPTFGFLCALINSKRHDAIYSSLIDPQETSRLSGFTPNKKADCIPVCSLQPVQNLHLS